MGATNGIGIKPYGSHGIDICGAECDVEGIICNENGGVVVGKKGGFEGGKLVAEGGSFGKVLRGDSYGELFSKVTEGLPGGVCGIRWGRGGVVEGMYKGGLTGG